MVWDNKNLNAAHTQRELDEIPQSPPYEGLGAGVEDDDAEEPDRVVLWAPISMALIVTASLIYMVLT